MQDQIIFQQLDNVRPRHADHFYIIGRCLDGKSVAAKVFRLLPIPIYQKHDRAE